MTTANQQNMVTLALLGLLLITTMDFTGAQTGVCYGRNGNGLPSPDNVVSICKQNNIRRMRIYDPDQPTLQALRSSDIELMLGVPNPDLQNIAESQGNADSWVQNNVKNYPDVKFRYIAVGNEVSPLRNAEYMGYVLPAMTNILNAISAAGLGIKVSTAVEFGIVDKSYPPKDGIFKPDVQSFINPIVEFLASNGLPILVNIYPYFSFNNNLDYALFKSPQTTPDGVSYGSLFDAQVDAAYSALEKAGGSSVEIVVSESGWPSDGGRETTIDNAGTYNNNLIRSVNSGSGTPKRPGRNIETYIFALFDEDKKNPEEEKHFGVFTANGQMKYPISF